MKKLHLIMLLIGLILITFTFGSVPCGFPASDFYVIPIKVKKDCPACPECPVCPECPSCEGPPSPIAKTGQTLSAGTTKRDDGALKEGIAWPTPRFIDNKDGTVTDNLTGLVWLKVLDCLTEMKWKDALTFCNTLKTGTCGLTDGSATGDWRLPNVKELLSLVDYGQRMPSLPTTHLFTCKTQVPIAKVFYWTSTRFADCVNYAWVLHISTGSSNADSIKDLHYPWPVRNKKSTPIASPIEKEGEKKESK